MADTYFINRDGKVIAKGSTEAVKKHIASGKIVKTDQIGKSPSGPWRPIAEIAGLAELFEAEAYDDWDVELGDDVYESEPSPADGGFETFQDAVAPPPLRKPEKKRKKAVQESSSSVVSDDRSSMLPGSLWHGVVSSLSALCSCEQLNGLSRTAATASLRVLACLIVMIPLLLVTIAIKTDSLSATFGAIMIGILLTVAQYGNERLLKITGLQLRTNETRISTSALFDVVSLFFVLAAIGALGAGVFDLIQNANVTAISGAIGVSLLCVAVGITALNPKFLGILVTPEATAADDLITLFSLPFKIVLAVAPFAYLAANVATGVLVLYVFKQLVADDLFPVIADTSIRTQLPVILFMPLCAYLSGVLGLFSVSVSSAVLSVPGKLEEVRLELKKK